jgi:hypothetical protein
MTSATVALKPSRDRKVSPLSKWSNANKRWEPMVANSFGLPAGPTGSCPYATEWCKGSVCYANTLESAFPSVGRLTVHNLEILKGAGSNVSAMVESLSALVSAFVAETAKVAKRTGREIPLVYRIHWDGDFYNHLYAIAWRKVADRFPQVTFWLYTRSFKWVAEAFEGSDNVSVYLSVDRYNADTARKVAESHPYVRFAFCGDSWDETESLSRDLTGRNAPRCPELTGKAPLVSDDGVGACVKCGLCIYGRNNVRFAKH